MADFGALAGLKVIDCTRVLGGPYCTQILADHGANVIKIEPPQGDEVRDWGPPFDPAGDAPYFLGVNRNKRSMALDLGNETGRQLFRDFLKDADILVENFKSGTLERWGLGYEPDLRSQFPRLIHARITGYGTDGPLGGLPGYDAVVQAMTGMFTVNGQPDGDATKLGIPIVDMGTGLFTAIGLLMAVIERQRSGHGQFLDMTLFDCAVALMHPHVANYLWSGKDPGRLGSAHPNIAPYDKFRTATDDVYLAAGNNRAFERLCTYLELAELPEDPRFRTNGDRVTNKAELTDRLQERLLAFEATDLCKQLLAAGVPAGPVLSTAQIMTHPHTKHREMLVERTDQRAAGTPVKLSRTPGRTDGKPPTFAADTREVLMEHGLDEDQIEALLQAGVVLDRRRRS